MLKGVYSTSKLSSNPIQFSNIGKCKLIFQSKAFISSLTECWDMFDKSLNKKITSAFYCRSPLQGQLQNSLANLLGHVYLGSQKMHHQLIIEVDDEIYYLITYGTDGLQIIKGLDLKEIQQIRKNNKIIQTKKDCKILVKDLVHLLKNTPHNSENYEPILWNCQIFSSRIWFEIK